MPMNKIMVVIDPTAEQQPAFDRAMESARLMGAKLHLYVGVDSESGYASAEEAEQQLQPTLNALAEQARDDNVEVSQELEFGSEWRRAASAAAARCSASMVFKNSHDHSAVDREKRVTADWTLLRLAPCPVLMVKNFHNWSHRRVLAAINPATTEQAHIKLNHQIVSFSQRFSETYGSDVHYVVAFNDLNHAPDVEQIARDCGVPVEHIHTQQGKAADVIRDTAKELDVDLVVVGTIGRDGIKGRVVGNTSEKLLDQTHSDMLVLS